MGPREIEPGLVDAKLPPSRVFVRVLASVREIIAENKKDGLN